MNYKILTAGLLLIAFACSTVAMGQTRPEPSILQSSAWPAGVLPKAELPQQGAYNYDFSKVEIDEIEAWLAWVRVELPVDVTGALSGWLWARPSERGWLNFSGYRIEGEFTSPKLVVENWEFNNAKLRFGYANETWYVGKLSGIVRSQGNVASIGQATFSAVLPTKAPQLLQLSGKLSQVKLEPLLDSLKVELDIVNESASVELAANVPFASTTDPAAWKAAASVDLRGIQFDDAPPTALLGRIEIDSGQWKVPGGKLSAIGQIVDFQGSGELDPKLPFAASIRSRNFPLSKLLAIARQPELSSRLSGTVDIVGAVRGGAERGIEAASAAVRSNEVVIDGEPLKEILVEAVLNNQVANQESLRIEIKSAKFADATVRGSLVWNSLQSISRLVPDEGDLELVELELSRLPTAFQPFEMGGVVNGTLSFSSQRSTAGQLQWSTQSRLQVTNLQASQTRIGDAVLVVTKRIAENQLTAEVTAEDASFNASLTAVLADDLGITPEDWILAYSAKGNAADFRIDLPLQPRDQLVPIVFTGSFDLHGAPENWLENGSAKISHLRLELDEQLFDLEDLWLNIREDAYRLERFQVTNEQGRVAGSALIRRNEAGEHVLNLRVERLELGPFAKAYAPPDLHGVTGKLSLEMRLKKAAAEQNMLLGWSGNVAGSASDVEYRSTPIGDVALQGGLDDSVLTLAADGRVLGGSLSLNARGRLNSLPGMVSSSASAAQDSEPMELSGSLSKVDLQRLMHIVVGKRFGKRYTGTADVEIVSASSQEPDDGWHLHLAIPTFNFDRQPLATELFAELLYRDTTLVVRDLSGGLAGGRVEVRGDLDLNQSRTAGMLNFSMERMKLSGLVALIFPEYVDQFSGEVSYRGAAQINKQVVLLGNARLTDVYVYGLPIQDVRNDLRISLTPSGELIEISSQNMHGTALGGRFDGDARIRGGARYALDSHVRIGNGKLDQLSRALGFEHIVGTGNFNLTSRIRSADASDLSALYGPIQLDFESGDAQSVPVLSEIARVVPVLHLASTNIKSGVMHGQLGNGQVRIRDVFLNGDSFWLIASGSAGLTSARLDVEALLQTGGGIDEQLAQSASQKLIALALPQLALLTEINDLVRNRTIYFHIGGTTKHPVIQVRAAQTAANALLQNVRRELMVLPSAAAAGDNN